MVLRTLTTNNHPPPSAPSKLNRGFARLWISVTSSVLVFRYTKLLFLRTHARVRPRVAVGAAKVFYFLGNRRQRLLSACRCRVRVSVLGRVMYVSPSLSTPLIALPNLRFIGEIFRIVSIMWHECSTAPPAPVPVCTAPVLTTAAAAHRVRSRCLQTLIKLDELIILSIFHARRRTRIRADVCEAPTMLEVKIYAPLCAIGKTFLSLDLFQRVLYVFSPAASGLKLL